MDIGGPSPVWVTPFPRLIRTLARHEPASEPASRASDSCPDFPQ